MLVQQASGPGGIVKLVPAGTGTTTVKTPDGATLQLPQKSVPQTVLVKKDGKAIAVAVPAGKDGKKEGETIG